MSIIENIISLIFFLLIIFSSLLFLSTTLWLSFFSLCKLLKKFSFKSSGSSTLLKLSIWNESWISLMSYSGICESLFLASILKLSLKSSLYSLYFWLICCILFILSKFSFNFKLLFGSFPVKGLFLIVSFFLSLLSKFNLFLFFDTLFSVAKLLSGLFLRLLTLFELSKLLLALVEGVYTLLFFDLGASLILLFNKFFFFNCSSLSLSFIDLRTTSCGMLASFIFAIEGSMLFTINPIWDSPCSKFFLFIKFFLLSTLNWL